MGLSWWFTRNAWTNSEYSAFPILGSVQTVILPILGQLLMPILIDHFGLFHTLLRPLSFIRFLGLISLIVGVLLIVFLPSYLQQKRQLMKETKEHAPSNFSGN